jgi:tRNA A-37 threonylcarbamoyl transferase component Bud32
MGSIDISPEFAEHLHRLGLRRFWDFFAYQGGEPVGGHPARYVTRVEFDGLRGYLKRENWVSWKCYLAGWWAGFGFVSKSRREWQVLQLLRKHGLPCPQPVAVGEANGKAFLFVQELPGMVDLHSYLIRNRDLAASVRRRLARSLGRTLARFHGAGFSHADLYAKHVFVDAANQTVQFIDFQRTRVRRHLSWRQRWRDLAALDATLSETLAAPMERLVCLAAYLQEAGSARRSRLLRRSVCAIALRSSQYQRRRKIQRMRSTPAPDRGVTLRRVVVHAAAPAVAGPDGDETPVASRERR